MKKFLLIGIVVAAAIFLFSRLPGAGEDSPAQHNVILIMLDTLRADHLGHYGYPRDTSPHLDAFARDALAFEYAISVSPWTPPSVASFFTGLYPTSHQMMPPDGRTLAQQQASRLDESHFTLAERFKAAGFGTGAMSPNPWITEEFGFGQGFDFFHYHARAKADLITEKSIEMIDNLLGLEKPFFAYIHYLDPHNPWRPPPPYDTMFQGEIPRAEFQYDERVTNIINLYDGEIRFMDHHIGILFDELRARGLYDNSHILIVADHGEQFTEQGQVGHGLQLYDTEIWVPLFFKPAGDFTPQRVDTLVSNVDVFATLLSAANLDIPEGIPSIPLTDLGRINQRRAVFSEIDRKYHQRALTVAPGLRMLSGTDQQGLEPPADWLDAVFLFFNSRFDGLAKQQLDKPELFDESLGLLDAALGHAEALKVIGDTDFVMQPETLEQLRSLGYVD